MAYALCTMWPGEIVAANFPFNSLHRSSVCFVALFYCSVILIKNFAQLTVAIAVSPLLVTLLPALGRSFLRILAARSGVWHADNKAVGPRATLCQNLLCLGLISTLPTLDRLSDFCYFYAAKPPLKPYAKYGHVKMCKQSGGWAKSYAFLYLYLFAALMSPCWWCWRHFGKTKAPNGGPNPS